MLPMPEIELPLTVPVSVLVAVAEDVLNELVMFEVAVPPLLAAAAASAAARAAPLLLLLSLALLVLELLLFAVDVCVEVFPSPD
jgi:predicted ABC-type sugar transport system permease subunit